MLENAVEVTLVQKNVADIFKIRAKFREVQSKPRWRYYSVEEIVHRGLWVEVLLKL
jgi:hypothetical protein